jgi:hypothetical protein
MSKGPAGGAGMISLDWSSWDPWRITPVRHSLVDHYLLQPDQLLELGKRLEERGRVRTHSADVTAGTPFNDAPTLCPNRKSTKETLAHIREAAAWTSLLNVQTDDTYRKLVDSFLDNVRPEVEKKDPGMCYRGGWIFVTSPRTITPFHIDKEHNFILQIYGTKTLYVWDHRDTHVVSERARERFHRFHQRDLIKWDESFKERAQVFHLEPGMGAYMPSTSPHMVENGPDASITVSFTYYTDSTRRDSLVRAFNDRLRGLGLNPADVGTRPAVDAAAYAAARIARAGENFVRRVKRANVLRDDCRYALADIG